MWQSAVLTPPSTSKLAAVICLDYRRALKRSVLARRIPPIVGRHVTQAEVAS
jgi:hypothetical protein